MTSTTADSAAALADEAALIERARNGDQAAWVQLYERCYTPVYRYVRARIFDSTTAEDIAAEVFAAAVRGIGRYRQQGRPVLAWLFGIAAHAVTDHQRRIGRQRRLHERLLPFGGSQRSTRGPQGPAQEDIAAFAATDEDETLVQRLDLAEAIEGLTAAQREVMILRYFVGLETPEIAAMIGKDASAVYSLHARALIALRGRLAEKDLPVRDESRRARTISTVEA
jgi:RNA polymerase sigma-70 factor, ECF subfamily